METVPARTRSRVIDLYPRAQSGVTIHQQDSSDAYDEQEDVEHEKPRCDIAANLPVAGIRVTFVFSGTA